MLRAFVCALGAWAAFPGSLRADEPHLEFVRGLRTRGMPDLAIEYLQRLSLNPPESIKAILPLELAKASLDLAALEGNEKKRAKQFDAARAAFDRFLKHNSNHPLAADAAFDIARLVALQGKHLLAQSRRADGIGLRKDLLSRARPLFDDAAQKLDAASNQIDAKIKALGEPQSDEDKTALKALTHSRLQARLETGINKLNSALTMPDNSSAEIKARAAKIAVAKAELDKLSNVDPESPICWNAKVWVGRCADELDDKRDARKTFESIAAEKSPAAEEAARTASFLMIKAAAEDKQVPNRNEQTKSAIAGLEEWIRKNRGSLNSTDGQAARYMLAVILEEQAQSGVTRDQQGVPSRVAPASRQTLVRVEKLLKEIADADGEYAERARNRRAGILVALMAERAAADVSKLVNFEECYLTAQVEAYEVTQGKKAEAEKARRFAKIVAVLRRGLLLADRSDSPRDVADARAMLAYTYLASGDPYAAAVYGEYLGRSNFAGGRGAEVTAYALQGYSGIIQIGRERNAPEDGIRSDQRRLRGLAAYMEKTWPDEPATDFARHQLGGFLLEDKNYAEACAMLARIAPSYPGIDQARFQQGAAAQRAQAKDVNLPADQKKKMLKQAIADLEQLPEPTPDASEDGTLAACLAHFQLGNLYLYDESPDGSNFDKAAAIGKKMAVLVPKLALDDKLRPQVLIEAAKLQLAGAQSRAFLFAKAGDLAEASRRLTPLVDGIRESLNKPKPPANSDESWYEGYREVQRQTIALALRIAIQQNAVDEAHKALTLLRKTAGPGDDANDRLLRLVFDLKREADEFRKRGETEKRETLEKGLVAFLDELAGAKTLADDVRLFLAQAYGSLERHDKSAELLAGFPNPKNGNEEATRRYQGVRLMLAKEYRLAKMIEQSKTVLQEILGSWGKSDLFVRREKIFLLEDAGNYGAAVAECRDIKRTLLPARIDFEKSVRDEKAADEAELKARTDDERQKAGQDRATAQAKKNGVQTLRDRFWEFDFYDTRIVLRSSMKVKDPAAREQKIAAVAASIKRLEDAHPEIVGKDLREKYLELFEIEPLLRVKYSEALGRVLLVTG